jgi:hypothetical protein
MSKSISNRKRPKLIEANCAEPAPGLSSEESVLVKEAAAHVIEKCD